MGNPFNKWKKKRDRYYKEKKRQYQAISESYGLGIKYEEYDPIAWEYADKKARSERDWLSSIFSGRNIFKTLLSIALAVISVVFPPLSVASSSVLMTLVATGAIVGLSATLYAMHAYDKMIGLSLEAQRIASATSALKSHLNAKTQRDSLTHMLIFNAYEIFANGEIYNAQNAGSQSYSPTLEYDPSKGILGSYKKLDIDERITTRAHTIEAGNMEYFSHTLQHEVPLKSAGISLEAVLDGLENKRRINNQRITQGFLELNKLYFNILGTAQAIYERVISEQIEPIEDYMIQSDFLERLKNYNKGLRADTQWLTKKDFKRKKTEKTEEEEIEMLERISQVWNEFQTNENYTLEERAMHYHDSVLWIYECLCAMETKVKIYRIETYSTQALQEAIQNAKWNQKAQLQETLEAVETLRAEQKELWSAYYEAQSVAEAQEKMQDYQNKQRVIESKQGNFINKIVPNIKVEHLRLILRVERTTTSYNVLTQTTTTITKTPLKELEITEAIKDIGEMSIKKAVEYYDRHLKARSMRLDSKNVLVLDFEEECIGILELSAKDFAPLGYDLPKHKDLESFEWERLDGEEESEEI
ncbi:hypothetical protein [Helicobacter sp.]|uniref:hypothetical protein n=1 Tax=Helicobacter sp. TaxID=218 RepID=UPI0019C9622E|nr:hypothetical protein [Helicobacter sp.]MBD5165227.1 hypothetical protein [Helicobacter sp.]